VIGADRTISEAIEPFVGTLAPDAKTGRWRPSHVERDGRYEFPKKPPSYTIALMTFARLIASGRLQRALLVAATLLVVQTAAAAHELQHALHHEENPACALHLYANHFGKGPTQAVVISLPSQPQDAPATRIPGVMPAATALGYYTRGPPRSS
jgi:hypothetical protein